VENQREGREGGKTGRFEMVKIGKGEAVGSDDEFSRILALLLFNFSSRLTAFPSFPYKTVEE
jgi:hypothetical protein